MRHPRMLQMRYDISHGGMLILRWLRVCWKLHRARYIKAEKAAQESGPTSVKAKHKKSPGKHKLIERSSTATNYVDIWGPMLVRNMVWRHYFLTMTIAQHTRTRMHNKSISWSSVANLGTPCVVGSKFERFFKNSAYGMRQRTSWDDKRDEGEGYWTHDAVRVFIRIEGTIRGLEPNAFG